MHLGNEQKISVMDGEIVFFAVFSVFEPAVNEDVQSLDWRFVIGKRHLSCQVAGELDGFAISICEFRLGG